MVAGVNGAAGRCAIVLVDDDSVSRELVVQYLEKLNVHNRVVQAEDGEVACTVLSDQAVEPVLVLLDMNMPKRSGLEVLRWLREESRFPDLPVVMLTGSAELEEVDAAYQFGIASYLVKPVGFGALQDVIFRLGLPWMILPPVAETAG